MGSPHRAHILPKKTCRGPACNPCTGVRSKRATDLIFVQDGGDHRAVRLPFCCVCNHSLLRPRGQVCGHCSCHCPYGRASGGLLLSAEVDPGGIRRCAMQWIQEEFEDVHCMIVHSPCVHLCLELLLCRVHMSPWILHMRVDQEQVCPFWGCRAQATVQLLSCQVSSVKSRLQHTQACPITTTTCAYTESCALKQCIFPSYFGRSLLCGCHGLWFPRFTCVHASFQTTGKAGPSTYTLIGTRLYSG